MEYLLSTNNLTKQYGAHKAADSINLHVKKGAIYGLIGRNGAGKTTILKMISGLASPTAGEYSLFGYTGKDVSKVMNRVGTLIEAPGLYPNLSAGQRNSGWRILQNVPILKWLPSPLRLSKW